MHEISLGRVPTITGGAGALDNLPSHIAGLTEEMSVAIIADPGLAAGGHIARMEQILAAAGFQTMVAILPPGEPKEVTVTEIVERARAAHAGLVVCAGGGSAMDAGKIVASLVPEGGDVAAYRLAATPLPHRRLPAICIPTTAGTGAEATAVSVLGGPDGVKYWFWGTTLKPDLILHDPELMVSLPPAVTAATGIDALVHAIEAATNVNANALNNVFAYRAIALSAQWLPVAVSEPANLAARAHMLEAATLAGIAIDNAGTAIAHNIAHALGSLAPVGHGRAVAIGMCATLAWNIEANPDVYIPVAELMGVPGGVAGLPAAFEALVRGVGVDLSVSGVSAQQLAHQMAEPENAAMLRANRRPVAPEDLLPHAAAALALS